MPSNSITLWKHINTILLYPKRLRNHWYFRPGFNLYLTFYFIQKDWETTTVCPRMLLDKCLAIQIINTSINSFWQWLIMFKWYFSALFAYVGSEMTISEITPPILHALGYGWVIIFLLYKYTHPPTHFVHNWCCSTGIWVRFLPILVKWHYWFNNIIRRGGTCPQIGTHEPIMLIHTSTIQIWTEVVRFVTIWVHFCSI